MFRETSQTVELAELSPTAAVATMEYPKWIPNPVVDGGSFQRYAGSPIITYDDVIIDRVLPNSVIADPRRKRLLMMAHARLIAADRNHGRQIYLFSAPWDSPLGPWTQLTAWDAPFIARGTAGVDFDDGCIYGASGCITGDTLNIMYHACNDDGANNHGEATGGQLIGMATYDLTDASTYVATKLGQLQIGAANYYGAHPCVHYERGLFHLFITSTAGGSLPSPNVKRYYTCPQFSTTASDWLLHPMMMEFGSDDEFEDAASDSVYIGDNRWYQAQYTGPYIRADMFEFQPEKIRRTQLGIIFAPAASGWDSSNVDEGTPLFHQGTWYLYHGSHDGDGKREVGVATYEFGTQEDQTGFTVLDTEYLPYVDAEIVIGPGGNAYAAGGVQVDFSTTNWAGYTPPYALKTVNRVEVQNPFILAGTQAIMASCTEHAGAIVKFALARPTASHTHTASQAAHSHADTAHRHGVGIYSDTLVDLTIDSQTPTVTVAASTAATGTEYSSTPGADLTVKYRVWGKPV